MKRFKRFMSFSVALAVTFGCFSFPAVSAGAAETAVQYTGERKLSFNSDWKFNLLSTAANVDNSLDGTAGAIDYDDTGGAWKDVEVPYDWSIYQTYGAGTQTPRDKQGSLAGGTGWYRKSFTLPDDFKGKSVTIQFDGVQMISEVWVNGVRNTAEWKQYLGYNTFQYDITRYLKFDGQKNTIAVKCFSGYQSARWYPGAGIYRNVWLIATDPVHVPVNGVSVTAPEDGLLPKYDLYQPMTNPTSAQVNIRTDLANDNSNPQTVSVKSTVYNKAGDVASVTADDIAVPANGTYRLSQTAYVPNPKLWSTDSPNLYWVKTEIISGGKTVDTLDTRFGIRYIDLNPNAGMYINGVLTKLNGVCEHSDLGPLGMETYQAAIDRRILEDKAMGANAIRTSHNPVSPEFTEACDRLGMMLMEEAFDQWARSKNSQDYSNYFTKSTADGTTPVFTVSTASADITINDPSLTSNAERDIKAMVDRDKNSPAVIIWSTGNEIDDDKYPYAPNLQRMLAGWIHEIDTTRPTVVVPPWWDNASGQFYNYFNAMSAADIGGFNYATDYYVRGHSEFPAMNLVGAETVSAFHTRGYYSPENYGVRTPSNRGTVKMCNEYPGETNFELENKSFIGIRDNTFMYGQFVWTGHDYLGEPTPFTGSPAPMSSSFGIMDTCGFEKDSFYLYKSMWTDIPTCHLLPQNWTQWTPGQQIPVVVYTNGRSVELYLNDKLIGTKSFNKATANPVYVEFGSVAFAPGELKAVSKDINGSVIAADAVYTAGAAQNVDLSADRAFIKNDGRDLVYIEATVEDSAGVMSPNANNTITVNVTGGHVIAAGNGDPNDVQAQRGVNYRKAFNGKALFIIAADKGYAGDMTISAASAGLVSNAVTVKAVTDIAGDGTSILSYEKPEITVGVGITPAMPQSVSGILDNGLLKDLAVGNWDMSGVDLNAAGDYTAYGTASGVSGSVECIVHVRAINSVSDISVTTIAGIYPPLPKFATIEYANGEIGAAPVTWDAVAASQYAGINRFDVKGRLGPSLTITAHVAVKQIISAQEVTVNTTVGVPPSMPAGVPVRFSDGTAETLAVTWNGVSQSDYAYPGQTQVFGNLLGSGIRAVANLHVQYLVYLSDLNWAGAAGTVAKDETVNGNQLGARNIQGGPPTYYTKGIGTLADSELVYDIAGMGYSSFSAYAGLGFDYGQGAPGAVVFKVYLDGALAYQSPIMDKGDQAQLISLGVAGVSTLRLVAEAAGADGAQYNLADWCDAKFLSDDIAVGTVTLPKQIYTNKINQIPVLPATAQAAVPGAGTGSFKIEWPPLTAGMFATAGVVPVYGRLAGTANGVALVKLITDYGNACTSADFSQKTGPWSETENFDFPTIAKGSNVNYSALTLTPRLIYSATANMIVENVQNYGFAYGTYPNASGSANRLVFATPSLTYFQITSISSTNAISNNGSFTFETSPDGAAWTALAGTAWTKGAIAPGTGDGYSGIWARRTYTSNDGAIPAGTNFLRVTYPSGNTWQFNITSAAFSGGGATSLYDADLAYFALGGYGGAIDHAAGTVTVTVPGNLDVTNLTPEVYVSPGAAYSPAGPQNFSNPVAYTVTNGAARKMYTVTVNRGFLVSFKLYGGNIGGDTGDITSLVSGGGFAQAPAVSPARDGYIFRGWTTDRASNVPMTVSSVPITGDTAFYAVWEKNPWVAITTNADAGLKTWQGEKSTNYGGDTSMLMRVNTTYGNFGETFANTSTTDSTDIKTDLVRFDISQYKGVNVKAAQLGLWYASVGNGTASSAITVRAARADSNWVENQVTWLTRPAFYASEGTAESASFSSGTAQAVSLDVTGIYNNAPAADNQLTFALSVNSSTADYSFTTKEGSAAAPSRTPTLRLALDVPPDYMITYDLNGGSGTAPIQPVLPAGGTFVAAPARGLLTGPAGRPMFTQWNTAADGSGTAYDPGDIVKMPAADLTLYAIWSDARAAVISYDASLPNWVGTVRVMTTEPDNTTLIIAAYGDSGVLLSSVSYPLDPNGGQEQDITTGFACPGAASVRAYLWDRSFSPMCAAVDIYNK